MKSATRVLVAILLAAGAAGNAGAAAPHPFTFDDMMQMHRIGGYDVSADGRWVVYAASDADVAANRMRSAIYLAPADGSAPPRKLADGGSPAVSPDGTTVAFVTAGGDGPPEIGIVPLRGGSVRLLTSLRTGAADPKWSPTGRFLLFSSDVFPDCPDVACSDARQRAMDAAVVKGRVVERLLYRHWNEWKDGKRTHVFRVGTDGSGLEDLTPGSFDAPGFGSDGDYDVSPDGKWVVYESNHDRVEAVSTNADVWLVPARGGQARDLTADNRAFDGGARFSPDGKFLAYRSQRRPAFESDRFELRVYDLASGASRSLTPDFDDWVGDFAWSPDGKSLYFTSNVAGYAPIYRVPRDGGPVDRVLAGVTAGSPLIRGGEIFYEASSISHPASVYRASLDGGMIREVTRDNDALLASLAMGRVAQRWYVSTDGSKIQAFVVTPPGFDPARKYPAILLIHGGPQGAWEDSWSYRWNPMLWACRGYVIYAPNPHGSTGYGQKFVDEISGDWGGQAYEDVMKAADDLESLPYVDASRVGAAGASFGGFMIDWIEGHTNRFKALFCHDGVFDQPAMFGSTEELWFPIWEMKGYPWTSDLYAKWNPAAFAAHFATPMLIVHSERDFRIPYSQAVELFTDLQIRGVPSKMLIFPNEDHFVLKPGDSRLWHATVFDWFRQYLGGEEGPRGTEPYSVTR